jgi:hypothetical protein
VGLFLSILIKKLSELGEKIYIYLFFFCLCVRAVSSIVVFYYQDNLMDLKMTKNEHYAMIIIINKHYLITSL